MPHQTHFKLEDIQKFLIHHFGLNTLDTYGSQKDGIMNYLNKVRAIQYDPINIVAPAADLLLAARFSNYSKDQLKQLLYEDNLLHEGWPYFEPIRQKRAHQHTFELKYRNTEETLEHLDFAYNHVLEHPNTSGSSIIISREKKGSWGSKNLFNSALTHLFYRGDIGISGREGNQKLYRDIRTMIPESILKKKPLSESDFYTWYILRRLDSLGIYWTKQGAGWLSFYLYKNKELKAAMKQLVADKQVIEISVESLKEKLYLTPSIYESILQ
ncbi:MAG: hypothetical protein GX760_03995, partial [Erysipelothrix sp.]|nr:hypothetical protein [Erysipelothrix sp.]